MSKFYKIKYILLLILIMGVFVMPSNFFGNMTKNIIDHIKYRGSLVTGEITVDNEDGTYDVKINNASSAFKNVETITYGAMFSIGEIVVIGYEYGNKELPKILGHSKKIPQEPYESEVDFSGGGEDGEGPGQGEGGGKQTETVTIYSTVKDGFIGIENKATYDEVHNPISGEDIDDSSDYITLGQQYTIGTGKYKIARGFIYFSTNNIPLNANITSAILILYIADYNIDIDFNIVIQDGQPDYPHSPLIANDYNKNNYHNNGGQFATSGIGVGYINIPLTSNGRNWINVGGTTKFCLRNSREIAGIVPTALEAVIIWASEKGDGYRPKLTITYEI